MPRYLPFEAATHRHRVGTRALDPATWIELGEDADGQLAEKRRLLSARHCEVVQVAGAEVAPPEQVADAGEELLHTLVAHLLRHAPDRYALDVGDMRDPRDGAPYVPRGSRLHPVDRAARLVPEDLCLHLPGADGQQVLVAASVAFPSRWVLAEKLGRPVAGIHAAVPGYQREIGAPVDRVLDRLTPQRGLWRLNGALLDDATLFQPGHHVRARPARVPDDVVLRVERQTLRRLPRTGAVVFTIRTYVDPLVSIAAEPASCAAVAGWLRGLPAELSNYKGLGRIGPAVLAWLDAHT